MFTEKDIEQMEAKGISAAKAEEQIERFKKGFPWLEIVAPATVGHGIRKLTAVQEDKAISFCDTAEVKGKCKFVPASGAASRMFKDLFAGMEEENDAVRKLAGNIREFAFYDSEIFPDGCNCAGQLLTDKGLGYGSKPKGVLKFHRYPQECRTAFAEHLVEGQEYMRSSDGSVKLTVTISPEHRPLFEDVLDDIKDIYEKRYGVRYDISFTSQDPSTDTIAAGIDGKPFRCDDGSLLFRPAGHGALIYNLNNVKEELVSIKNIDNVSVERLLPVTARYKKVLMGKCLELRDRIFGYLYAMDQITGPATFQAFPFLPGYNGVAIDRYATEECQRLCQEIEDFLSEELCIEMPVAKDCESRYWALHDKLNRPIRVCGMVRNEGEPGGGPFIVKGKDGATSLQILESVQINGDDAGAVNAKNSATHFNPVDIVCCLYGYNGEKFDLTEYVDEETGFISSKSYKGRELKALELPGLWNGAMSDWNTMFVEVPVETFNPVKVVLDLLRPAHRN